MKHYGRKYTEEKQLSRWFAEGGSQPVTQPKLQCLPNRKLKKQL